MELHLGIAAIPGIPGGLNPGETSLEELSASRPELTNESRLCTIHFDDRTMHETAVPLSVTRSISSAPDVVNDLVILDKNGMYEAGWPAQHKADYDQNGEVNIADMTPLAILMGAKETSAGWLIDAHARVDGDDNGEINIADLTPIGQNFGDTLAAFRLERSTGDAGGPTANWEIVGSSDLSGKTQSGKGVQSLGNAPYQRVAVATSLGWPWFRVIAIDVDGVESPPSVAVLAPDIAPPQWPIGPGLEILENSIPTGIIAGFNSDATDDRSESVQYSMHLTGRT